MRQRAVSRRRCVVVGVAALALLAGCRDTSSEAGRTGTGATTPGPAPADTPALAAGGLTGSGQAGTDGGQPSALAGTGEDGAAPAGGGGAGAPTVVPGLEGLQILGVPVFALPPEVVAAAGTGGTGGTGTGGDGGLGTGTGTGTNTGGTGTNPGGTGTGTNGNGGTGGNGGVTRPPLPTTGEFCAPARDLSDALAAVAAAQGPGDLEAAVGWGRQSFANAQAAAPPGLDEDVDVLAGAFGRFFDGLEQAGYDRARVSTGSFLALSSRNVVAAKDRFNQFLNDVC